MNAFIHHNSSEQKIVQWRLKVATFPFLMQPSHPSNTINTRDSDVRVVPRHQQGLIQRIETCLVGSRKHPENLQNTKRNRSMPNFVGAQPQAWPRGKRGVRRFLGYPLVRGIPKWTHQARILPKAQPFKVRVGAYITRPECRDSSRYVNHPSSFLSSFLNFEDESSSYRKRLQE